MPDRSLALSVLPTLFLALMSLAGATPLRAACTFTVVFENQQLPYSTTGPTGEVIVIDPASIRIRSRASPAVLALGITPIWGPWRRAQAGGLFPNRQRLRLEPGQQVSGTYRAAGLCQDQREIEYIVACQSGSRAGGRFFASSSHPGSWSSNQRRWMVRYDSHFRCNP